MIDKLKNKLVLGSAISDIKQYFTKINEVIDSVNGNIVLSVYNNLIATSTTLTGTTTVLNYGVNVFTTITSINYAARLPQPVTGKSIKVINMTNNTLVLFPSNVGGQINNYPINFPAQIPPDGKSYEFICIKNPLPGAWTWSPPATTQYNSGIITCNTTGGNKVIMASSTGNFVERTGFTSSSGWGYDGKNLALVQNLGTELCFKESNQWLGITKIKVYTNLSALSAASTFGLTSGGQTTYYDPLDTTTAGIIASGSAGAGNYGDSLSFYGDCSQAIAGPSIPAGTLTTNIGDAGTQWGELLLVGASSAAGSNVGDQFVGNVPNTFYPTPLTLDKWISNYISFGIKNNIVTTGFKFQFFIEHF